MVSLLFSQYRQYCFKHRKTKEVVDTCKSQSKNSNATIAMSKCKTLLKSSQTITLQRKQKIVQHETHYYLWKYNYTHVKIIFFSMILYTIDKSSIPFRKCSQGTALTLIY